MQGLFRYSRLDLFKIHKGSQKYFISSFLSVYICQEDTKAIDCQGRGNITIISARYGRTEREICGVTSGTWFTYCPRDDVFQFINMQCHDEVYCYFTASTRFLRLEQETCRRLPNKYLEIDYNCTGGE